MEKKLYRDEYRKKLAGVCAGLAEYFTVDVAIVRVLFVLACIFHGGGGLVYVVLWIALPKKPYLYTDPTVDYKVPPENPGSAPFNAPGNNPFGNNPFQGNPFGSQPFTTPPYPNPPFTPQPKSNGTSLFAIIFGVVLIIVGGSILLDNLDILPDWDFGKLWPIVPIIIGCILMMSGSNKKDIDWKKADADKKAESTTETNPPADNPPAV